MPKFGIEHPRAKATFEEIEHMRFLYFEMRVRPRKIRERYGVTRAALDNWLQFRSRIDK